MSYKPTPITAKILKTTKGGITQPILNMGAAVTKMKAPSVAKQTARMFFTPGGENTEIAKNSQKTKTTEKAKAAGNSKGKLKPGEGVLKTPPKSSAGNFEPAGKQKDFIPWAFRQDNKIGGGSNSGVKGKMGSDTRKAEYDKKGWAYDETISKASVKKATEKANPRAKVKAANTIKAKKEDTKKIRTASLETKIDPNNLKTQAAKEKAKPSKGAVRKANRKLDSADRKDSRAARVAQKAKEARASGNTAKADRLKRREARITKRANKKRGQATSAIQPK